MIKSWQEAPKFYNRWLREESRKPADKLKLDWQQPSELLSVLAVILKYVKSSNTGKVRLDIQRGKISISGVDSKEMY